MKFIGRLMAVVASSVGIASVGTAQAQDAQFPNKPIRFITASVGSESDSQTDTTSVQQVFGVVIDPPTRNGSVTPGPTPVTIDLSPTGAPNGSWFLAEGAANSTANGFKTYYLIQNSNPVDVSVRAYFSDEGGNTTMKTFTVPKASRTTVSDT